jgi:hypothetical protein
MTRDDRTRCPGCKGLVIDGNWFDHTDCLDEYDKARKHDETDRDDYPDYEPRERIA